MRPYYLAVPGAALTSTEREYIKETASTFAGIAIFFGIGVMRGGSFHCMRAGNSTATIYGLDIDYTTKLLHRPDLINGIWLEGDSRDYKFSWGIDFLFVDGDHHYETIKADIENWKGRINKNGIIMFHDYKPKARDLGTMPWLKGVKRAVDEWDKQDFLEIGRVDSIITYERT